MNAEGLRSIKPIWAAALVLVVVVGVAAVYEVGLARPLGTSVYFVVAAFCSLSLMLVARRQPAVVKAGLVAVLLISLTILHLVPWNSRKIFLASLEAVEEGMTPGDVEKVLGRYLRVSGSPALGAAVYRHSTESRFDSDFGIVHYQQGRVSKVEFLPD